MAGHRNKIARAVSLFYDPAIGERGSDAADKTGPDRPPDLA
jgi:hypothetical protein